jgi:adenine-specific DNA-methyltransferase
VEKTVHPCQFPIELVERLVLSMTEPRDWVLDPFAGVGSALAAAVRHGRRAAGAELDKSYVAIAKKRLIQASSGVLPVRAMGQPVYDPALSGKSLTSRPWSTEENQPIGGQFVLLDSAKSKYKVKK